MSRLSDAAVTEDSSSADAVYAADGTPLFAIESEFSLDVGATVQLNDPLSEFQMTTEISDAIFSHIETGEYWTLILNMEDPFQNQISVDPDVNDQLWSNSCQSLMIINSALAWRTSPLDNLTIHKHRHWNDKALVLIRTVVEKSVRDGTNLVLRIVTHGPGQMDSSFVWKLMGVLMRADGASRRPVSLVFEARDTTLRIAELVKPLRILTANSVVRGLSIYRNIAWAPNVEGSFAAPRSEVVDVFQMDLVREEVLDAPILFEMIGDIPTIDHLWIALKGSAQLNDEGATALAKLLDRSSPPMRDIALVGNLMLDGEAIVVDRLFQGHDVPRIFRAIGARTLTKLTLAHRFTQAEVDSLILGRNDVHRGERMEGSIAHLILRSSIFEGASYAALLSAIFRMEKRLLALDLAGSWITRDVANVLAIHLTTEPCPLQMLIIDDCRFEDGSAQRTLFSSFLSNNSLLTLDMAGVVILDADMERSLELHSALMEHRNRESAPR